MCCSSRARYFSISSSTPLPGSECEGVCVILNHPKWWLLSGPFIRTRREQWAPNTNHPSTYPSTHRGLCNGSGGWQRGNFVFYCVTDRKFLCHLNNFCFNCNKNKLSREQHPERDGCNPLDDDSLLAIIRISLSSPPPLELIPLLTLPSFRNAHPPYSRGTKEAVCFHWKRTILWVANDKEGVNIIRRKYFDILVKWSLIKGPLNCLIGST